VTAGSAPPPLSGPVEDYLKAIYDLERGEPATTNDIAVRLDISPASVAVLGGAELLLLGVGAGVIVMARRNRTAEEA